MSFEFFAPLHLSTFYRVAREKGIADAIRAAVRKEDGWETEVEEKDGYVVFRFRLLGAGWTEIEVRDVPRAWVWWTPPPLRRSFTLIWEEEDGGTIIEGPLLTDSQVWCDYCGAPVECRPVPLLVGLYALCPRCMELRVGITLHEAARMDGIELEWLDP